MIKVVGILMMISIIIAGIILYNLQNVKSRLISKMIVITLFLSGISIGLNYFFPETTFPFVLPLLVVLAAFVVCAMIWEAIQYPKTVARIIKQFTLPNVLFLLLVGSALFLTARLDLIQYILYCIGILGTMIFVLLVIEAKKKQENHEISLLADIPVESKEELVPSRQQDLIHIKRLLEINNYREPFALMINDDWGTGKTSLINVLMKDLEEEGHYIIFMQPMVWDDQHKMMDYFFSQLESLLYEKGIYTGKNSAFERYANLITQTLNTAHQSAVYGADLWKSFLGNQQPTNYREQKKQLEEDIGLLLGEVDKHIYLIVDDCDRVDEGVFKQVLMFIKEVVNFRGIDVLFLMDESKVAANDETLTPEYLEKFVSQKYKLSKIDYKDLYLYNYNLEKKEFEVKTDVVKDIIIGLEQSVEDDSYLNNASNILNHKLGNMRRSKHFNRNIFLILKILNEEIVKNESEMLEHNLKKSKESLPYLIQILVMTKLFYEGEYQKYPSELLKYYLFNSESAGRKVNEDSTLYNEILKEIAKADLGKILKLYKGKMSEGDVGELQTVEMINNIMFDFIMNPKELNTQLFKEILGEEEEFQRFLSDKDNWPAINYEKYSFIRCVKHMKNNSEQYLKEFLNKTPLPSIEDILFCIDFNNKGSYTWKLEEFFAFFQFESYRTVLKQAIMYNKKQAFFLSFKDSLNIKICDMYNVSDRSSEFKAIKSLKELDIKKKGDTKLSLEIMTYEKEIIEYIRYNELYELLQSVEVSSDFRESIRNSDEIYKELKSMDTTPKEKYIKEVKKNKDNLTRVQLRDLYERI